jgi:hypothetical protein
MTKFFLKEKNIHCLILKVSHDLQTLVPHNVYLSTAGNQLSLAYDDLVCGLGFITLKTWKNKAKHINVKYFNTKIGEFDKLEQTLKSSKLKFY